MSACLHPKHHSARLCLACYKAERRGEETDTTLLRGVFFVDSHWGYEIRSGAKRPLHDLAAHEVLRQIVSDWQPQVAVMGGDGLDCGAASHWNRNKPRLTEGLRLEKDAAEYYEQVLEPVARTATERHYILGNHEHWVDQFVDENPSIEGLVSVDKMLGLSANGWTLHGQGQTMHVGKLHFMHGDTVQSSIYPARYAVDKYVRSICFGHFHSPQSHTRVSALDASDVHTARAVGCLCRKDPGYGRGAPNRWAQGFLLFEVANDGTFQTYDVNITAGKAVWHGKVYRA